MDIFLNRQWRLRRHEREDENLGTGSVWKSFPEASGGGQSGGREEIVGIIDILTALTTCPLTQPFRFNPMDLHM
jgi:hypothetical protein